MFTSSPSNILSWLGAAPNGACLVGGRLPLGRGLKAILSYLAKGLLLLVAFFILEAPRQARLGQSWVADGAPSNFYFAKQVSRWGLSFLRATSSNPYIGQPSTCRIKTRKQYLHCNALGQNNPKQFLGRRSDVICCRVTYVQPSSVCYPGNISFLVPILVVRFKAVARRA